MTAVADDTEASRTSSLQALEQEVGVLIRRVRRMIGVRARAVHPELQPASYLILSSIVQSGPVRASSVAETFDIDKGAVSRQVKHLTDIGLLASTPDPDDGRATLLAVSEEGMRRMNDVAVHRHKLLDERLADWSAEELADFVGELGRYNASLNDLS